MSEILQKIRSQSLEKPFDYNVLIRDQESMVSILYRSEDLLKLAQPTCIIASFTIDSWKITSQRKEKVFDYRHLIGHYKCL